MLATVILTVGVGSVAAAPADRAAPTGKCYVGATGPIIKYPRIWAVGYFCSPNRRTDAATVILQGHIGGKWKALATLHKQLKMSPGQKYTLRTPPIHCTAHPPDVNMRGWVSLAAGPPTGTIVVHNVGGRTYCIS